MNNIRNKNCEVSERCRYIACTLDCVPEQVDIESLDTIINQGSLGYQSTELTICSPPEKILENVPECAILGALDAAT